jgi:hypothetical protein
MSSRRRNKAARTRVCLQRLAKVLLFRDAQVKRIRMRLTDFFRKAQAMRIRVYSEVKLI